MKLPEPNYGRGQSSLGRDPTDPTAVSRAQYAAAGAEAGVGTALAGAGEAFARAGAQQARTGDVMANTGETMVRTGSIMAGKVTAIGQIGKALHQTADVFDTWDKAADSVRANTGLAGYVRGTTELIDTIKTQASVKTADLPDAWLKPNETREQIPMWEIAPKLYDARERDLRKAAMADVTRVEHRQELEVQLATKNVGNASTVRTFHLTEKLKDMKGQDEESIKTFIQSGKPQDAVNVIEKGFKNGTWNPLERITKIEKIWHDSEDLETARLIGMADGPTILRRIGDDILAKQNSRLTPDERRSYANQAIAKADHLAKENEINRNRQERDDSKRIAGDLSTRIRLEGYIPNMKELAEAKKILTPTDYMALIALVDRKDGNGQVKPDQATIKDLTLKIFALGKPDASGIPNHLRADVVMDQLNTAFAVNKLDPTTHEKLVAQLERYRDRALKKSPEHTIAEDLIEANLLPPKGFMQQFTAGELTRFGALANEMKIELLDATRKDPKLDPVSWTRQNLPRYRALAEGDIHTQLFNIGLGTYARLTTDNKFDTTATRSALTEGLKKNEISEALYKRAINTLSLIKEPTPTGKKDDKR